MAAKKDLLLIISTTSGKQEDIAPKLELLLTSSRRTFKIKLVKKPSEAAELVKKYKNQYKTIGIYGGDGTVTAGLKELIDSKAQFLLLPGGTENTIARELGVSGETEVILNNYLKGLFTTEQFDIAMVNNKPLAFNMHFGLLTDAIKETPRASKKRFGAVAYAIAALKQLPQTTSEQYILEIKGKLKKLKGYGMFVSNSGEQSFLGIRLFPKSHKPGYVQVAIAKKLSPPRVILWTLGRLLHMGNLGGVIKIYRAQQLRIIQAPSERYFDDEITTTDLPLHVRGGQKSVAVIVPKNKNST